MFKQKVLDFIKSLILFCLYENKDSLRKPVFERIPFADIKFEEKSENLDILTLQFGEEVIILNIHYEKAILPIIHKDFNTGQRKIIEKSAYKVVKIEF